MENVQEKLAALAEMQKIHSQIDKIRRVRGGLPEEVSDLEDELAGLQTRVDRLQEEINELNAEVKSRKEKIKENEVAVKKYKEQQSEIKNNREYEALEKEIEFSELDTLTHKKKIKVLEEKVKLVQVSKEEVTAKHTERVKDLEDKKGELDLIVKETEEEEKKLQKQAGAAEKKVDSRILNAYHNIRLNMRNGLAVVGTDRNACGGCFAIIPPQRLAEIRQQKKIIICENCGRILVDNTFFVPQPA
jgi:uncharacterized protein